MVIRKQFKFEGSHIVRNCTSRRCSHSVHGHSYILEVFLEAFKLDNGGMVLDFGILKEMLGPWVDAFDHCHLIWQGESKEYKDFFKKNNERWIILPCNPTAENISKVFFNILHRIICDWEFKNGEDPNLHVFKVRCHETATGYADCYPGDARLDDNLRDMEFSPELASKLNLELLL